MLRAGEGILAAALLMAGCSYPYGSFQEDFLTAYCPQQASCLYGIEEAQCMSAEVNDPDCAYDASAAKSCIDELEGVACDAVLGSIVLPDACAATCGDLSTDSGA